MYCLFYKCNVNIVLPAVATSVTLVSLGGREGEEQNTSLIVSGLIEQLALFCT